MNKILIIIAMLFSTYYISAQTKSFYDFTVKDIAGNDFNLSQLKGKKVLVVNTASKCGLTPQYELLQELYLKYKNHNFIIIGFPSNDFKNQEPGSNKEISEFCTLNYGVTFPLMDKVNVIGDKQAPIYEWLTHKSENGKMDTTVQWNFQKYMIDEDGRLINCLLPKEPFYSKIESWIEKK